MLGLNLTNIRRTAMSALAAMGLGAAGLAMTAGAAQAQSFEEFLKSENGAVLDGRERVRDVPPALRQALFAVAQPDNGRIGVAALDLNTGAEVSILGEQAFPMASTSKIAIAATFLAGVDAGRYSLQHKYPLMIPVASKAFSTPVAPVKPGMMLTAQSLIELMITRSDNTATDAMLAAVGGPKAVTAWLRSAGIDRQRIDRDIATLVRDDGEFDPALVVDERDSTPPAEMVELIAGLYQGKWLSPKSRDVVIGAMTRTVTGRSRIKAGLPSGVEFGHKTGTLNNTASDVGFVEMPDGRVIVMAIYVTGQGGRAQRSQKIASIARTLYNGFAQNRYAGNEAGRRAP
ncbi:serine hydrolase [uncultured Croceicoccus sp.]|uniref:serine hydrolase n=1 Tax=uncultured Croceicoccus sp. TaxID=1295329 RepID=UPI002614A776|nr:serine hydrolase [uncultured Croceicoccus sp.]